MGKRLLSTGWMVKVKTPQVDPLLDADNPEGWLPTEVPSTAHDVLWQAGRLPNPYVSSSLPRLTPSFGWDFLYRCHFTVDKNAGPNRRLIFEGLDTIATVWLNGELLLQSDNMFVAHTVPIDRFLRDGEQVLLIWFQSAQTEAATRLEKWGPRAVWNGEPGRVYVRKAQFHFGWDFGPPLLSAGPWKPIVLTDDPVCIQCLNAPFAVADDLATATLRLHPIIRGDLPEETVLDVELRLTDPEGQLVFCEPRQLPGCGGELWHEHTLESPDLWWPAGHGRQPLYTVSVAVFHAGRLLCEKTLRLGARKLELVRDYETHTDGESFYFRINNRPIFCGGANWIPPELSLSRIGSQQIAALLNCAVEANLCMLRVWGGGIYESDGFYDLCDQLGLLVFQDFAFACGVYPGHAWFVQSVATEARQAIERLRHHPCLVLWSGNNEDYCIAHSLGLYPGPRSEIPPPPAPTDAMCFDGRVLYEEILRDLVSEHSPQIPYTPGSPFGRQNPDPNDRLDGDCHIWEVWHGSQRDYQQFGELSGRFVSEFGMQAVPSHPTLVAGLGFPPDGVSVLYGLNKGQAGPERIDTYLGRNLTIPKDLPRYVYATQLLQAEALEHGLLAFRRAFGRADARGCGGGLVWQLNDCWPGVSWSFLEHHAAADTRPVRRKAAFFAVRRALAPWVLGLVWTKADHFSVWASHAGPVVPVSDLSLSFVGFDAVGQKRFAHTQPVSPDSIEYNASFELGNHVLPQTNLVVLAELKDQDTVLARATLWPQPLRDFPCVDPELLFEEEPQNPGKRTLRLSVTRPTKGLWLMAGDDALFSDNLLDILPGQTVVVCVKDPADAPIRWLGLHSLLSV